MIQEPCASDGRLAWVSESAEQAVNTPNDEERLEQMSHPKNKVMERMTPLERWNGLAWVCTTWLRKRENGLAGVCMEWLWKGLARCGGEGSSGTTVFPQTQRVRLVRGSLCGCDLTTSISSKGMQGQANRRERTNRRLAQATIQEVLHQKPMFRATFVTCSRTSQTDGYRRPRSTGCLPKKSHQRSQSTGCVLVRKSTDEATQSDISITESKVDRDGVSNTRQGVNVQSTWPGCEVELGTCHCFAIPLPQFTHAFPEVVIANDREGPWW